jgi:hypothetical protein
MTVGQTIADAIVTLGNIDINVGGWTVDRDALTIITDHWWDIRDLSNLSAKIAETTTRAARTG